MADQYIHRLVALAEQAGAGNDENLDRVAERFADTLAAGGLVHLYGSGHSILPCQEAFPRYGSFIGFNPLTDPRTMWHNVLGAGGVRELLWLERTENYAEKFLDHQPLNEAAATRKGRAFSFSMAPRNRMHSQKAHFTKSSAGTADA